MYNLIHACCYYTDENYVTIAEKDEDYFATTLKCVDVFSKTIKKLLSKLLKTPYKKSFETLKTVNSVKELNNGLQSVLLFESDKHNVHHICVKKEEVIFYRSFFELYFFEKCATERYLTFMKQNKQNHDLFNQFAWVEWQIFCNHFSALINLLCKQKDFS